MRIRQDMTTTLWLLILLLIAAPITGCAKQTETPSWSQGTYIWDSRALLNGQQRSKELKRLQDQDMVDLLVGLSAEQVRNPGSIEELQALVREAHAHGQRVLLLLGDPAWITPGDRPQLMALIRRFKSVPFDGLHLDLEVEQLGWPVPATRLQQWLDTLKEAQRQSPWPLSISSHPRWFETNSGDQPSEPCVPCALKGLTTVDLMLYSRHLERVNERTLAIANRWPELHFRLAQSVEPDMEPGLSWNGSTAGALRMQMQRWRAVLQPNGIRGIDWQDWAAYPKEQ
jgi:hypothetical protein